MSRELHVSKNGGEYESLGAALGTIPADNTEPVTIYLHEGIYREKLIINQPYLTIVGEGADKTILTHGDYARMVMPDGSSRGTFRTQTLLVHTHDFTARDLTIENSAGYGKVVGQAIALYVDGDRNSFIGCRLLGCQDTLFTGPLPPAAYQTGGFTGPLEHAPRINGRQYYYKCYIRGEVDFVFGSATAYFEECEIFSLKYDEKPAAADPANQKIYGYVTAASTPEGQEYGYIFDRCRLTSDCPPGSVYLGRPWRSFARTVYLNCELGEHIRQEGWYDWDKPEAHATICYGEYHSIGPGADPAGRADYARQLTDEEARTYAKDRVLWFRL